MDISQAALSDAEAKLKEKKPAIELWQLDAQQRLPFTLGEFNVIICSELLEHVPDPKAVLENIHKIADTDTRIIISVPIEGPKIFIKKILIKLGLFKILFKDIEENQSEWHQHAFSKNKLTEMSGDLFYTRRHKNICLIHHVARWSKK